MSKAILYTESSTATVIPGDVSFSGNISASGYVSADPTTGFKFGSSPFARLGGSYNIFQCSTGQDAIAFGFTGDPKMYLHADEYDFQTLAQVSYSNLNNTRLALAQTTASTSRTTGALTCAGGIGAAKAVNAACFGSSIPTTQTGATYTVLDTDSSIIANRVGTVTLTLLAAATYPGRWLYLKTIQAQTVVSAASNVVPIAGGSASTPILPATIGAWAILQSDGANWVTMARGT